MPCRSGIVARSSARLVRASARPTRASPECEVVVSVADCTISKRRIVSHLPGDPFTPRRIYDSQGPPAVYADLRELDSRKQVE